MSPLRVALVIVGALVIAAVLLLAFASPALAPGGVLAPPTTSPTPTSPGLDPPEVDGERAYEHVVFLADPARGGRYTASAGYEEAARYVAERFAEIGLEPWGDGGTFFHRFTMPLVDLSATPLLERTTAPARTYRHRVDFTERVGGAFGSGTGQGELVFVGGGTAEDLEVVDVRGKVALVLLSGARDPARELARAGAVGAIYVSDQIIKFSFIADMDSATIPGLVVTIDATNDLLSDTGRTVTDLLRAVREQQAGADSAAFATRTTVRVSVPLTPVREVEAANVVGLLRGSDPDLAQQAVVVGGHLDGVGTDPDGTVFQAANDNASGAAVTIEVARALAARRQELAHSVIFIAFAGEEQGLVGSEAYLAETATLPGRRESLLAFLNLDVVGCCGEAVSASAESRSLLQRVEDAAERLGVPFDPGGFPSSDHKSFVNRGIHATLLNWSGGSPIHTTRDTIDRIDADRLRDVGRVAALVALEIAAGR